jgi:(p)ppGpp synthase/HD superfamily hydrolase
MNLTEVFDFANRYHQDQTKKGTEYPYIYHPMSVAATALKYGGSPEQVAAALLHDTIGDGKVTKEEIAQKFGAETARLVFGFSDPEMPEGADTGWRAMKQAYLGKVREIDEATLFVIACEELHDGSELLHDLKYQGPSVWKRYPVHGMEVFWYYRELLAIFSKRLAGDRYRPLVAEFGAMMKAMKGIVFEGAVY